MFCFTLCHVNWNLMVWNNNEYLIREVCRKTRPGIVSIINYNKKKRPDMFRKLSATVKRAVLREISKTGISFKIVNRFKLKCKVENVFKNLHYKNIALMQD